MQEDLHKELRLAGISTIILDLICWIVSLFLIGFSIPVLVGFLLGSAGMMGNLFLLRNSILNAVYNGKTRDIKSYLFRVLIASVVIALGLMTDFVNVISAVLPFLYPKIIFGILSFRQK